MIPKHEYVELKGSSMGLFDPDSLDERLRRAEHDPGRLDRPPLEIGLPYNRSHCWLCRRRSEEVGR